MDGSAELNIFRHRIEHFLYISLLKIKILYSGMPLFNSKFHPKHSFIVGSGGIPIEDFLTLDLENLFE